MHKLRELILLRHAKSDWKDDQHSDIERPISAKGKKQATKVAKWLQDHALLPDLILVSPAKRAQQTYRRICKECPSESITLDELYLAELDTLKTVLAKVKNAHRVMIIGHNPGLEQLYRFLLPPQPNEQPHLFPTASIAHFILPNCWQQLESGDGKLQQFVRPKDIKFKQLD